MSKPKQPPDLSITALYTNATWTWGKLPNAELLANVEAKRVFDATNGVLDLMRLVRRRVPSLRHSLIQRHLIIDGLMAEARPAHVLELAAGLSRRGLTASADPTVTYVEVDRAPVIARKRALLERTPAGRAALARPNLRLVSADLADPSVSLADLVTAPPGAPLFVIAEGLFMYLDAAAQHALWTRLRALFASRPGTLVFDLVPTIEQPKPGAFGRSLEWLMKRFTGGASFTRDTRTRDDLAADLRALGFTVELMAPQDVIDRFALPHRDVRTQQLIFVCRRS